MNMTSKALVVGLLLAAGVAIAAEGVTDPTVIAREDVMKINAGAMKTLGGMAKGDVAFDAVAAEAAKAALIAAAADIPVKFKEPATDPKSAAKPEIWTNWDEFADYAGKLSAAATAMDASSLEGVRAGIDAVGKSCGDCHTEFKIKV